MPRLRRLPRRDDPARSSGAVSVGGLVTFAITVCAVFVGGNSSAHAFDYLEHLYFTDYACTRTLALLGERLASEPNNETLAARYVALALTCPERWEAPYCANGYKLAESQVSALDEPPATSHDYSITLGDFAALPDHVAAFGPVRNLPRAGDHGLVEWFAQWMSPGAGSPGGTIEDVAEDACEDENAADYAQIDKDIDAYIKRVRVTGQPDAIPSELLSPVLRAPVPKGPFDPAGAYSFDNPHYLDLIFRNHHHFGIHAYSSWLGFHGVGINLAKGRCEDAMALEEDELEDLAGDDPRYADIDWDELPDERRRQLGCALFSHRVEDRIKRWLERAQPEVIKPVDGRLSAILKGPRTLTGQGFLDKVTVSLLSLVLEGGGLHFLQDGLASGHMRTIRTRGGLGEARHDHDRDNEDGVVALFQTRTGRYPFVAHGDAFLMGPAYKADRRCDAPPSTMTPEWTTNCLVAHQRGLLGAVTMASLLDWALGGTSFGTYDTKKIESYCQAEPGTLERFICGHLPTRATLVAGEEDLGGAEPLMLHGALPVPPPDFSYEALSSDIGLDVGGRATQFRLVWSTLDEMGDFAHWLRSMRVALGTTNGGGRDEQWYGEYAYAFHYRVAARFTIDAMASGYSGVRSIGGDRALFLGVAPSVGFTALPEGWIKMPLQASVHYRLPITLLDSQEVWPSRVIEGHYIYFGLGLAFMK